MKVKLVRHTFADRPDWVLINETVPLGTEYEVFGLFPGEIRNKDTGDRRSIDMYLVSGNGDNGLLPKDCFEVVE